MDTRVLILLTLAVVGGAFGSYRAVLWLLRSRRRAMVDAEAAVRARRAAIGRRWPEVGAALTAARDWALAVPDDAPLLLAAAAGVERAAAARLDGPADADAETVLMEEARTLAGMVQRCRERAVSAAGDG